MVLETIAFIWVSTNTHCYSDGTLHFIFGTGTLSYVVVYGQHLINVGDPLASAALVDQQEKRVQEISNFQSWVIVNIGFS